MRKHLKTFSALGLLAAAALVLASCSPTSPSTSPTASPSETGSSAGTGVIKIVTSTNVWASVIEFIGGDLVEVTALVSDVSQDPHSYEATARDQLAVSEAELVVANGGGYDDFMQVLVAAAKTNPELLTAIAEEEEDHADEGEEDHADEDGHDHGNEHIWYDFHDVAAFSAVIAAKLGELRPDGQTQIAANFDLFQSELDNAEIRLEALRERAIGLGIIAVEGVGNLLLTEAGFENLTPDSLADAIEEEREVPLTALEETRSLIDSGQVALFISNAQVVDTQIEALTAYALAAGVKVITLSEMIPDIENQDYLDWMNQVLDQLQEAVY